MHPDAKDPDDELRIYIVVRRDVGDAISKPKFGVQCAHATLSVWGRCLQTDPDRAYAYLPCDTDKVDTGQAKVVLEAKNDTELLKIAAQATELGFPVVEITDAARTELPEPTLTAIAIGPIWHKKEGLFLKRVRLYKDRSIQRHEEWPFDKEPQLFGPLMSGVKDEQG